MLLALLATIALLMVVSIVAAAAVHLHRSGLVRAFNIAEGTHEGSVSRKAAGAITTRFLLVKPTATLNEVDIAGAADRPLGLCDDEAAAAGDLVNVNLLGISKRTLLMVASEAIAIDDEVYTAAGGKVQDLPTAAGTYWKVGRPIVAAGADGDLLEVEPCLPEKLVIAP